MTPDELTPQERYELIVALNYATMTLIDNRNTYDDYTEEDLAAIKQRLENWDRLMTRLGSPTEP